MKPAIDHYDNRDFLLQSAVWQDSLLQSYRSLHITLQSILLAIGIGLLIASMSASSFPKPTIETVTATVLLGVVGALQWFTTTRMRRIIQARGDDVNYWHRAIILAEQELPPHQRHFTNFKIHQQARRKNVDHLRDLFLGETRISEDKADILIEKGIGHTRRVVDQQLFLGISLIWVALFVVGVGTLIYGIFAP